MVWNRIESRQNDAVKFAAGLFDKRARDKAGAFCADGFSIFFDLAAAGVFPACVYLSDTAVSMRQSIERALSPDTLCRLYLLSETAFEKITSEKGSEGIVSVYEKRAVHTANPLRAFRRLIALENLQDPGNVGSIVRSAAAFGCDGVLLCGGADPFGPKAVRASMGAFARIPLAVFSNADLALDFLEEKSVRSLASCLSSEALTPRQMNTAPPVCLWIGNEGSGLSPAVLLRAHQKIMIPMQYMESLNAACAASVLLWEMTK